MQCWTQKVCEIKDDGSFWLRFTLICPLGDTGLKFGFCQYVLPVMAIIMVQNLDKWTPLNSEHPIFFSLSFSPPYTNHWSQIELCPYLKFHHLVSLGINFISSFHLFSQLRTVTRYLLGHDIEVKMLRRCSRVFNLYMLMLLCSGI